ncbi:MAG: M1 family metallopeptidase [Gammaproteobacteria bacterium]|nr:M1 family metallopeptidase [Gammaproteobacteria bacterium]
MTENELFRDFIIISIPRTCRPLRYVVATLFAFCLFFLFGTAQAQVQSANGFDVLHYAAGVVPALQARTVRGNEQITVQATQNDVKVLRFDSGSLVIDAIRQGGEKLRFKKVGSRLDIQLPAVLDSGDRTTVEITYHEAPTHGMEFHPEVSEVYTIFATSQWLVCIDSPSERATLDLRVTLPAGFKAIGNGRLVSRSVLKNKKLVYHWRQDVPVSSFAYGFAAGKFNEVQTRQSGIRLRFLSHDLSAAQLRKVFHDTGDILKFFGSKAGIPYRGSYSQALVAKTIGQEYAGFAVLSEAYGKHVLKHPGGVFLIAHEAAHQWWGIGVTCRSWRDFWLNEGFANFMAAAYIKHRYGDKAYRQIIADWRQDVQDLRRLGKDHALVFKSWSHPTKFDRAVVYKKGAYVLYLLKSKLGGKAFWKGIRFYTHKYWGKSVAAKDFEKAMEKSTGRDLGTFFQKWVYGATLGAPVTTSTSIAEVF